MSKKPHILITNDDGIHSPGLMHLCESVKDFARVSIIAPLTEQSGVGMSLTWRHPLRIESMPWTDSVSAWSVSGTPTDCVKMGLSALLTESPPDLIISGINKGSNAGRNALYSGTVAGVIEGVLHNVPGIAFSCWDFTNPDYSPTAPYIAAIIHHVIAHPLPKGTLLNVNFPPESTGKIQGIKLTTQGKEYWAENPEKRFHPADAFHYYWLGARLAEFEEEEDSDIYWLKKGYVAAVPIRIDQTDHHHLKERKHHFDNISVIKK
jgi:5'-nucleotidase